MKVINERKRKRKKDCLVSCGFQYKIKRVECPPPFFLVNIMLEIYTKQITIVYWSKTQTFAEVLHIPMIDFALCPPGEANALLYLPGLFYLCCSFLIPAEVFVSNSTNKKMRSNKNSSKCTDIKKCGGDLW